MLGDGVIAEGPEVFTTVVVVIIDDLRPLLGDVARLLLLLLAVTLLRREVNSLPGGPGLILYNLGK